MRELGPVVDDVVRFPLPRPTVSPSGIEGEILRVDHFGNALTNIHYLRWVDAATLIYSPALTGDETVEMPPFQADQATVIAGGHTLAGIHPTYSAAPLAP